MSSLHEYEKTVDGWYKKSPVHLPDTARVWIADNAWWIVLIGVILSIASVVNSLYTLFWADQVLNDLRQFAAAAGVDTGRSALTEISLWVSIVTFAVAVIIEVRAITPLKSRQKSGWDLLVLASLVSVAGGLVAGILAGSIITTILFVVIGAVISGFFLFEIRGKFLPNAKQPKVHTPKDA